MVTILAKCFQRSRGLSSSRDEAMPESPLWMVCRDRHDDTNDRWIQAAPEGIIGPMRAWRRSLVAVGLSAAASLAAAPAQARLRIMATVFPLREFAAAVAGDRGEASLLLPPGAGVHTWQPRPGDLARLSST